MAALWAGDASFCFFSFFMLWASALALLPSLSWRLSFPICLFWSQSLCLWPFFLPPRPLPWLPICLSVLRSVLLSVGSASQGSSRFLVFPAAPAASALLGLCLRVSVPVSASLPRPLPDSGPSHLLGKSKHLIFFAVNRFNVHLLVAQGQKRVTFQIIVVSGVSSGGKCSKSVEKI